MMVREILNEKTIPLFEGREHLLEKALGDLDSFDVELMKEVIEDAQHDD